MLPPNHIEWTVGRNGIEEPSTTVRPLSQERFRSAWEAPESWARWGGLSVLRMGARSIVLQHHTESYVGFNEDDPGLFETHLQRLYRLDVGLPCPHFE